MVFWKPDRCRGVGTGKEGRPRRSGGSEGADAEGRRSRAHPQRRGDRQGTGTPGPQRRARERAGAREGRTGAEARGPLQNTFPFAQGPRNANAPRASGLRGSRRRGREGRTGKFCKIRISNFVL